MRRHLGISAVQSRIKPVCLDHGRLQLVRHHGLRHDAQKRKHTHMGEDPVLQPLGAHRLGIDVIDAPVVPQARPWRDAATKSFMAGTSPVAGSITSMVSPAKSTNTFSPPTWFWRVALKANHRCDVGRTRPFQASKLLAEPGIAKPVGGLGPILLQQKRPRLAGLAQLTVDHRTRGKGNDRRHATCRIDRMGCRVFA